MKTPVNPIQVLIDHASGRVHHINLGSCPDILEGYDSRDPDFPVCCAIAEQAQPEPTTAIYTVVFDAWYNYQRMGEVCSFEGNSMIYASTLEEIYESVVTQPVHPTPPGWKLVPVSPTEEMIRAGVKEREGQAVYKSVSRAGTLIFEGNAAFEYCAMLAAAPVYGIGYLGAPATGDVK